jgi:type IV secretion system protein VirD4
MTSMDQRSTSSGTDILFVGLFGLLGLFGVLWCAAAASAVVCGHPVPHGHAIGAFAAFEHAGNPSSAWHAPVGPAAVYWTVTVLLVLALFALAFFGWRWWRHDTAKRTNDASKLPGLAGRAEVKIAAGQKTLLRKAPSIRPALAQAVPGDVGYVLGRSRGLKCWASTEDSMILLGPPRSGKGLHLVIPLILDAPGSVITTSTRPDNLAVTMQARSTIGPVAVFDPQRLAPGIPAMTKWSPVRGCENPQTALIRAKALGHGSAGGTENGNFWEQQTLTALRCLLHAAAIGGKNALDLYRWSLSAVAAKEAVTILGTHPDAAPAWDRALDAIVSAEQRQRDSVWAMVSNAFAALADPAVLDAVSPVPGAGFEPAAFLHAKGTVYLLGTASGASATAGLVAAFVEDVVEAARRIAASSAGSRLDPPLSLILDEAANYPLPSLASLMSEGGGTGICTLVVLQSLAQARAQWGEHEGAAIWDAAIVKIVLGGGSNAKDLADLSSLIGTREETQTSESRGADGKKSSSTSARQVPILEPGQLRTLPFGYGVLLLRSAPPIMLGLQRWIDRADAQDLQAGRVNLEQAIRVAAGLSAPPSGATQVNRA